MSLCSVCQTSPINVKFTDCRHACCCQECANQLLNNQRNPRCPICRNSLTSDQEDHQIYEIIFLNGVNDNGDSVAIDRELREELDTEKKRSSELAQKVDQLETDLQREERSMGIEECAISVIKAQKNIVARASMGVAITTTMPIVSVGKVFGLW